MARILIVDDDKNTRKYFRHLIVDAGFEAYTSESADEALKLMDDLSFDLLVLDVTMPGMNGIELTTMLRNDGLQIPILMVSARCSNTDVNQGLIAGADDYMIKPVDEEELILRIKALFRRSNVQYQNKLVIGSTTLEQKTQSVTDSQVQLHLPSKEFELLYLLLSYPNQVFTREQLLFKIWGPSSDSEPATINVHINRLRKRFKHNTDFAIQTQRGYGYKATILN